MKQEYRHTKPIRGKNPLYPSYDCEEDLDFASDLSYNIWSEENNKVRDEKDNKDKVPD